MSKAWTAIKRAHYIPWKHPRRQTRDIVAALNAVWWTWAIICMVYGASILYLGIARGAAGNAIYESTYNGFAHMLPGVRGIYYAVLLLVFAVVGCFKLQRALRVMFKAWVNHDDST